MLSIQPVAPGVNPGRPGPPHAFTAALPPTRTYPFVRRAAVAPAGGGRFRVVITQQRSAGSRPVASEYHVSAAPVGPRFGRGRGFRFEAADGSGVRFAFLADDRAASLCDCEGFCYESARRADRRHRSASPTLGCKHLDAAAAIDAEDRADLAARDAAGPPPTACGWCAGTGAVPGCLGELAPCPECDPHRTPALID